MASVTKIEGFDLQFGIFILKLQALITRHYADSSPVLQAQQKIVVDHGQVRARVRHAQCGVYCFVDYATGNILKAADYRAPAKHPRGNIFNANPLQGCGVYGPAYLR
jgi:hypothetical protein